jgi:hypothetical protein
MNGCGVARRAVVASSDDPPATSTKASTSSAAIPKKNKPKPPLAVRPPPPNEPMFRGLAAGLAGDGDLAKPLWRAPVHPTTPSPAMDGCAEANVTAVGPSAKPPTGPADGGAGRKPAGGSTIGAPEVTWVGGTTTKPPRAGTLDPDGAGARLADAAGPEDDPDAGRSGVVREFPVAPEPVPRAGGVGATGPGVRVRAF